MLACHFHAKKMMVRCRSWLMLESLGSHSTLKARIRLSQTSLFYAGSSHYCPSPTAFEMSLVTRPNGSYIGLCSSMWNSSNVQLLSHSVYFLRKWKLDRFRHSDPPQRTRKEKKEWDEPLVRSVPASGVGSVDGPAVHWFLDTSVYSLIEYLAAKRQSLLVNGKGQVPYDNFK